MNKSLPLSPEEELRTAILLSGYKLSPDQIDKVCALLNEGWEFDWCLCFAGRMAAYRALGLPTRRPGRLRMLWHNLTNPFREWLEIRRERRDEPEGKL